MAQAHTNYKAQEQAANLVQSQREMTLAQREVSPVQWELAQANRATAEAMLIAMREAQGCGVVPCQEDELQVWFHGAQGVVAIAQPSFAGYGNVEVE